MLVASTISSNFRKQIGKLVSESGGASQLGLAVKNVPANERDIRDAGLIPELGRFPWRRAWLPTPGFLPKESHGQRRLAGYNPWDCKSRT